MDKSLKRAAPVLAILALIVLFQFFAHFQLLGADLGKFHQFILILSAIVFEALPFVLIGVVAASLMEMYVSEQRLQKLIPKSRVKGILLASVIGLVIPICECGIIPVVRKLLKKGLPIYLGMVMIMAVPIVNPVVILSTYFAFYGLPLFVFSRLAFGFIVAILVGFLLSYMKQPKLSITKRDEYEDFCSQCIVGKPAFSQLMFYSTYELFLMGKFLIFGASLSALIQVMTPRPLLEAIGSGSVLAIVIMMLLTFGLSLCSEADAFVARSFLLTFSPHSVLAFLVLGPMIDVKNTFMLLTTFKKKFVMKFIALLFIVVFILMYAMQYVLPLT